MPFGINPATGKPGPAPNLPRSGDKKQARQRINVEVRTGRRPHPNELPCTDCGHIWRDGERRHEYDHYRGYAPDHHLDVEPVCTDCHAKRDSAKAKQTHCGRGHEFTPENTTLKANGTRECRACRKVWNSNHHRGGRDAAYWRAYRLERKARNG
jgi:hypothetical protein